MRFAFALAALVIAAGSARASFFNGNEMFDYCGSDKSLVYGYSAGASDAFEGEGTPAGPRYCMPSEFTIHQIGDVYCKFLRDNPEFRNEAAGDVFRRMLERSYLCGKS